MILQILQYPEHEKLLRTKARLIEPEELETQKEQFAALAEDMADTAAAHNAAGLAATQILAAWQVMFGHPEPPALVLVRSMRGDTAVLANPEVLSVSKERTMSNEGCLSFAMGNARANLPAPATVSVRALSLDGKLMEFSSEGFEARCVAHETDHLSGRIMVDRLGRLARMQFLKDLAREKGKAARG